MDLSTMSLTEALRLLAERRVLAMTKQADRASAVASAQDARARLGLLGTPEAKVNDTVGAFNRGELGRLGAINRIGRHTPGAISQLVNVPGAVGTALQQGRPGEAAAQADVPGLKNLADPLTLGASLGAAGVAGVGQHYVRQGLNMNKLLSGGHGAEGVKAMERALGKDSAKFKEWNNVWRRRPENMPRESGLPGDVASAVGKARGPGLPPGGPKPGLGARAGALLGDAKAKGTAGLGALGRGLLGPSSVELRPAVPMKTVKGKPPKVTPGRPALTLGRRELAQAVRLLPRSTAGRLAAFGVPAAAALAPLALREWMLPGGYRSGRGPAARLVDANAELGRPKPRK